MSNGEQSVAQGDLDFLFTKQGNAGAPGAGNAQDPDQSDKVTIRGDLDKIDLADIFQTLTMSKMEGILKVRNAIENREVYFAEGSVRYRFPESVGTRRIGKGLISAAIVSPDELRMALVTHKKEGIPFEDVLLDQDLVPPEDLSDLTAQLLEEDLYDLFTWRRGSFEFYKGAPDEETIALFKSSAQFDVSAALLEVARRADEWSVILEVFAGVDEIPLLIGDVDASVLDGDHALIADAIDGKQSIRDLAESTLLGLFSCSRSILDLFREGYVELAGAEHLLELAHDQVVAGEHKRAMVMVQTMMDREADADVEMVEAIAEIMQECGEGKQAAALLLECARALSEPEERLAMARYAREMHRDSVPVLGFLKDELSEVLLDTTEEYIDVCTQLSEALAEAGESQRALSLLVELEERVPEDTGVLLRKARILHKAGEAEEAVKALLKVADHHKATGQKSRLVAIYEQVLKVDPRHKDASKALRDLRASKTKRLIQRASVVAGVLLLVLLGYLYLESQRMSAKLETGLQEAKAFLSKEKIKDANVVISSLLLDFEKDPRVAELQGRLRDLRDAINRRKHQKKLAAEQSRISLAGEYVEQGKITEALGVYREMVESGKDSKSLMEAAKPYFGKLMPRLQQIVTSLKRLTPPEPSALQTDDERTRLITELSAGLKVVPNGLAARVLAAKDNEMLTKVLGGEDVQRLLEVAASVQGSVKLARIRELAYETYQARLANNRRLDPIFAAARRHEKRFEFTPALEKYRRLVREHTQDDDLKDHFRDQVKRYATIVRYLDVIQKASRAGDFKTAQGQLRFLKRSYGNIPFESLVQLPVRVRTTPTRARVFVNEEQVGRSPLITAYRPAAKTKIHIRLKGFHDEVTTLTGDNIGSVRSILARKHSSAYSMQGAVERRPAIHGGLFFVTDRAGIVSALDPSRTEPVWTYKTKDLSGLLTRPILFEETLIVGSIDGTLRALRCADGKIAWSLDKQPTQVDPVLCGRYLILLTTDHKLVRVDTSKRTKTVLAEIADSAEGRLLARGQYALVISRTGVIHKFGARDGGLVWKLDLTKHGIPMGACQTPNALIIATDEGHLVCLDIEKGKVRWEKTGIRNVTVGPAIRGETVILPTNSGLETFSVDKGSRGRTVQLTGEKWAGPPSVDRRCVYLPTESGKVIVLDQKSLELLYLLRGNGTACLAPLTLPNGSIVAGFDKRELLVFKPLR